MNARVIDPAIGGRDSLDGIEATNGALASTNAVTTTNTGIERVGQVAVPTSARSVPTIVSQLDKALALLERGFSVFPLGSFAEDPPAYFIKNRFGGDIEKARAQWTKQPRTSWKALQTAQPTEEEVRRWWGQQWQSANIGIACGSLVVIDADSKEAAEWCKANLTYTPWTVSTGTDVKRHFYFQVNPDIEIKNSVDAGAKVDVRAMGGYVVAGGSRHASGRWYKDEIDSGEDATTLTVSDLPMLTQRDVDAILTYRTQNVGTESIGSQRGNIAGFDANAVRAKATGEPVIEGGRNNAAASLIGQLIKQGFLLPDINKQMYSWNATCTPPMADAELNTTIKSICRIHNHNHPGQQVLLETPPREPDAPPVASSHKATFPKHLLIPPGFIGEVASYITRTAIKPQPLLSLGAAVALGGTIMGRKVRTSSDLRTNPYIVAIADSGAGKEHPRQAIKRLLSEAGCLFLLGAEDLASDAGLFATIYKHPSSLLCMDEIGSFFKMVMADRAPPHLLAIKSLLLRLTGGAVGPFPDKVRAQNADSEVRVVDQPNVCLYGSTVPGRLFQSLKKDDITDGFLPRILCLHSDDPDPDTQRVADKTPPPEMVKLVRRWSTRTINAYPKGDIDLTCNPLIVETSPEAQLVFDEFEKANRGRKNATRGSGIDAIWARADEHAMRLALIVACGCDYDNPVIDRVHAEWACEFVTFVMKRAIVEIDLNVGDSAHELTVKRVLEFFKQEKIVDKSKLSRRFQDLRPFEIKAAMDTLTDSGHISGPRTVTPAGNKGGRPKTVYDFLG